jgi:DNA-directed RNA polymerase II subunit RPB1
MGSYRVSLKTIRDSIIKALDPGNKIQILISPEFQCIIDRALPRGSVRRDSESHLYNLVRDNIFPIEIWGIKGIEYGYIENSVIYTKLSDLMIKLGLELVDKSLPMSNAALDVLNRLGVEAARNPIVRGLKKVERRSSL